MPRRPLGRCGRWRSEGCNLSNPPVAPPSSPPPVRSAGRPGAVSAASPTSSPRIHPTAPHETRRSHRTHVTEESRSRTDWCDDRQRRSRPRVSTPGDRDPSGLGVGDATETAPDRLVDLTGGGATGGSQRLRPSDRPVPQERQQRADLTSTADVQSPWLRPPHPHGTRRSPRPHLSLSVVGGWGGPRVSAPVSLSTPSTPSVRSARRPDTAVSPPPLVWVSRSRDHRRLAVLGSRGSDKTVRP